MQRFDAAGQVARYNSVVLPKDANYGKVFEKEFRTSADNMTEIPIALYKGDSADLGQCEPLMTFTITGLPPGRAKGQPVRVKLAYDKSGILRGTATDVGTNREVEIVVDRSKPDPATM